MGIVRCAGYIRWETFDYHWRAPQPLALAAATPPAGSYVMDTVCRLEPTFYGLNVPLGAADTTVDAIVDVAFGAGDPVGMVQVCRNVARWVTTSLSAGTAPGRAVQVDPRKPVLKAPGSMLLTLIYDD